MFARSIQQLTLIAFTVHAVLGCCLHHSHAIGAECCGEHVATEHELSHDHEGHCCHSHVSSAFTGKAVAESVETLPAIDAICCEYSHKHSQQCQEASCSFAPTTVKPIDVTFDLVVWGTLFNGVNGTLLVKLHPGGSDARLLDARLHNGVFDSSAYHCALLQSWQI